MKEIDPPVNIFNDRIELYDGLLWFMKVKGLLMVPS